VEKISLAVNNYFASLEGGAEEGALATDALVEGDPVLEEAAPEAGAEAAVEAAAQEDATVPEAAAEAESTSDEKHEHEPENGSAPEKTE
jgi:hypothetical protein